MSRKRIFTKEEIDRIIHLYQNEKLATAVIGERFDVLKDIINKVLVDNNIPIRKKGRQPTGFNRKEYYKKYDEARKEERKEYFANRRNNKKQKGEN